MSVFVLFESLTNFIVIPVLVFTGFYLWKKFKDDFDTETIGIILILTGFFIFLMAARKTFSDLELIDEGLALFLFFVEYIIILFFVLLFIFPRFLYLVTNRPIVKGVGLILGVLFYIIYLVIHFNQKEKIIPHHAPIGLLFELPPLEKIFILVIFGVILPLMFYRTIFHFYQWRKTKIFPYKLLNYLFLFFFGLCFPIYYFPVFKPWTIIFAKILALGGILSIYFVSSQELIRKEELIQIPKEGELKERAEALEKLQELKTEMRSRIAGLEKEIKKLKKS